MTPRNRQQECPVANIMSKSRFIKYCNSSILMLSLIKIILLMVVIMAWNVRGIISSTLCLSSLLERDNCYIAILTEHKLKSETKTYLDSIHSDFYSFVKTDDSDLVQGIGTSYNTGKGVWLSCVGNPFPSPLKKSHALNQTES